MSASAVHHLRYRWVVHAAGTVAQASTAAYFLELAAICLLAAAPLSNPAAAGPILVAAGAAGASVNAASGRVVLT